MQRTFFAHLAKQVVRTIYLVVTVAGCASGHDQNDSTDPDGAVATTQQAWYSTTPYDNHGLMTFSATQNANGRGITWDVKIDWVKGIFPWPIQGFSGKLVEGNVGADSTTSASNSPFYVRLWGPERAHHNNHHFLRVAGGESLDAACGNSVADIYLGTYKALGWRAQGDIDNFMRAIGAVTHAIQDSFAPAHTRRDAQSSHSNKFVDLCSIHEDFPGACRHPDSDVNSGDDMDDNTALRDQAIAATTDYLNAVADVATDRDPGALHAAVAKWFTCPMLTWLPATWST